MLKTLNSSKWETPDEIEAEYPDCKYIITDFSDVNDITGHLYAVSDDRDSFDMLCKISDELSSDGVTCCIMGE